VEILLDHASILPFCAGTHDESFWAEEGQEHQAGMAMHTYVPCSVKGDGRMDRIPRGDDEHECAAAKNTPDAPVVAGGGITGEGGGGGVG
jgi:hypothetical protein